MVQRARHLGVLEAAQRGPPAGREGAARAAGARREEERRQRLFDDEKRDGEKEEEEVMKQSDDELRMQIDALIRDNIQEVINDYVDEKEESVKESGLGFVKKEGEDNQLKVNISKDEVDKLIQEYKKIKRQQKSNFSEIKKLDLLDKDRRPL